CSLILGQKLAVLDEKLRLQNVKAIEFGEEIRCRIGHVPHGVLWVELVPLGKRLVGLRELQIIHLAEAQIETERREWNLRGSQRSGEEKQINETVKHQISSTRRAIPIASGQTINEEYINSPHMSRGVHERVCACNSVTTTRGTP